jgi:hypothetical protein
LNDALLESWVRGFRFECSLDEITHGDFLPVEFLASGADPDMVAPRLPFGFVQTASGSRGGPEFGVIVNGRVH